MMAPFVKFADPLLQWRVLVRSEGKPSSGARLLLRRHSMTDFSNVSKFNHFRRSILKYVDMYRGSDRVASAGQRHNWPVQCDDFFVAAVVNRCPGLTHAVPSPQPVSKFGLFATRLGRGGRESRACHADSAHCPQVPTWCAQRNSTPTWPTATPRSSAASVIVPHRPHDHRRDRRSTRRRPARADPARRHRLAAIPARSTRPKHNPSFGSPATTTKPDLVPRTRRAPSALQNKRGSTPSNAFGDPIGIPHAVLDGLAQRYRTPRRASRPSPRIVGQSPPRGARAMRHMLSNCVPATTCPHSAPEPPP
jgi:hypothetical protein